MMKKYDLPLCAPLNMQFNIEKMKEELNKIQDKFIPVNEANRLLTITNWLTLYMIILTRLI